MDPTTSGVPDFLLIEISQHCAVETIKNLRLVCHRFHAVIDAYQHTICSHAAHQCFTKEEIKVFQLYRPKFLDFEALLQLDRRHKILNILTDYLFRNSRLGQIITGCQSISAIEISAFKSRLRTGFAVLWNLTSIAKDIQAERGVTRVGTNNRRDGNIVSSQSSSKSKNNAVKSRLRIGIGVLSRLARSQKGLPIDQEYENTVKADSQPEYIQDIFRSWGDHVAKLGLQLRSDYALMRFNLAEALDGQFFGPLHDDWMDIGSYKDYRKGDCWLSWFVLSAGPEFFGKAWKLIDGFPQDSSEVYSTWTCASYNERLWQYRAGRETEASLVGYGDNEASRQTEYMRLRADFGWARIPHLDSYDVDFSFYLGSSINWAGVHNLQRRLGSEFGSRRVLARVEPTRWQIALRDEVHPWKVEQESRREIQEDKWSDIIPPELTYRAGRPQGPRRMPDSGVVDEDLVDQVPTWSIDPLLVSANG